MTQEQVVNIATDISFLMMKNGAEIYRVEQCVRFIAEAYGFEEADCFAILTSIVVTVMDGEKICTRTKRVTGRVTDLNKVALLNDLSRYICSAKPDYVEVKDRIYNIIKIKPYPFWVYILTYMVVSFFFGLYFGGGIICGLYCGLTGVVVYPVQWVGEKLKTNLFVTNMLTSVAITGVLCFIHQHFYSDNFDIMVISLIMNLVPGVALTHCMRDLISNELISGLARLAEVAIIGAGIAVGVFVILSMYGLAI